MKTAILAFLGVILLNGCGWYYLEKDPHEVALKTHAPEFELSQADGERVRLSDLQQKGHVVLVFYRGEW